MFDNAEDDLSSSSSGSFAEGPSTAEMTPKEVLEVGTKEDGYLLDHAKDGNFSDLDHPSPYHAHLHCIPISHKHYHCRMCEQEFENKSDMQRHAKDVHRMDEKSHKCQKCLKSFPSSQQLAQHLLVHTNVRKYSCRFCDKMFKQLSHVQQHLRIHTGERPYKCTVDTCPKSFRQLSSLQQHIKGHNIPLPKSYPISKPSSNHYSSSNQIIARPHDLICQVCERHCENDSMFFQHLQQQHPDYWKVLSGEHKHVKEKGDVMEVFVCPCCSQEFSQIGDLKKHRDQEHPEDEINDSNFNICVCQKIFNNDSQFLKHLQLKIDFQHQEKYAEIVKKIQYSKFKHSDGSRNGVGEGCTEYIGPSDEYVERMLDEEGAKAEVLNKAKLDKEDGDELEDGVSLKRTSFAFSESPQRNHPVQHLKREQDEDEEEEEA